MTIAGKTLVVVGAGLLALAVCIFLASLPSDGWGPSGARFGLIVSAFPGVPGACALLLGIYLVRQTRTLREFNEAMEWNNRSFRGTACDGTGSPIPKATVDVFVDGAERSQRVTTMLTDARGRFSADLPEGQYVLEVWAPEIGNFSIPVAVSKSVNNAELHIKLVAAHSISDV